jgi:hypothetical protein
MCLCLSVLSVHSDTSNGGYNSPAWLPLMHLHGSPGNKFYQPISHMHQTSATLEDTGSYVDSAHWHCCPYTSANAVIILHGYHHSLASVSIFLHMCSRISLNNCLRQLSGLYFMHPRIQFCVYGTTGTCYTSAQFLTNFARPLRASDMKYLVLEIVHG